MKHRHHHHHHSKSSKTKRLSLESFLTTYFPIIIGVTILAIGTYNVFTSGNIIYWLKDLILKLFQPGNELQITPVYNGSIGLIICYFLPGFIILILSELFSKKYKTISYVSSLFLIIYFAIIQIKILGVDSFYGIYDYPSFFTADLFLGISLIGFFINAIHLKKAHILIWISFYFYICLSLLTFCFGWFLSYLLPFSLLFSIVFAWSVGKLKNPGINLINFFLFLGYFGLFWLRKFFANNQVDFLLPFFIYGALFYKIFNWVVSFSSNAKEKPMPKWMQLTMGLTNLAFYFGTTAFVISKYYSFGYVWILVIALLAFNIAILAISSKHFPTLWKFPYHIAIIILAALLFPLIVNQSIILLFSAVLSILLLLYSKTTKDLIYVWLSYFAMAVMILTFVYQWAFSVSQLFNDKLPFSKSVWQAIFNGIVVVITLTLNYRLLENQKKTLTQNKFLRSRYNNLILGVDLFILFLTVGLFISNFICFVCGSLLVTSTAWFISGSLFFILLSLFLSKQHSTFTKPILFFSLGFLFFYPMLVYLNMRESINQLISSGTFSFGSILVHYLALALGISLAIFVIRRVYSRSHMTLTLRRSLQSISIIFLLFILATEFDNLSILFQAGQFIQKPSGSVGNEILMSNRFIPYSIILLITSLVILVWSLFKRFRFLRNLSIILFSISILKILLFDLTILTQTTRTIIFFTLGFLLISFSLLYPRLKKQATTIAKDHHHHHHHSSKPNPTSPSTPTPTP